MKPIRFILLIMSIAAASSVLAQAPQQFNYQAVARDASGNPISEKQLGVRISILDGSATGSALYSEVSTPSTNKQGLFSVQVGSGTGVFGTFSAIVWGGSARFLKVEIDPAGGSAYQLLGASQLLSVPYALSANKLAAPLAISELSDVSDVVPMVDQVLKWDGTSWTPGSGSGLTVSDEFLGEGTSLDPLKIAPQGATNGQVLQWNGAKWSPATVSGGVGDNWGTQNVITSTALSGVGTTLSPLTIAQQGAVNGQVLRWDGSKWGPGSAAGDNWGTAKVNTSTQFEGDGTPGSPLKLGSNSAAVGQSLMWNGTNWVPEFLSASFEVPYTQNANNTNPLFQLVNVGGSAIKGTATGTAANLTGVEGIIGTSAGGNGSAGVQGRNVSTTANGYGVAGFHSGTGVALYGETAGAGIGMSSRAGANGIGAYGSATGATGYGVVGLANTGVSGTTNTAAGRGIYGSATAGGYAGWFDARTMIKSNSTVTDANLAIWEDDTADKARISFNNGVASKYWNISGRTTTSASPDLDKFAITHFSNGDILTVSGDKRVGINIGNPAAELDVNGSIKVQGNIIANAVAGANGQVLQSDGTKVVWGYGTIGLYNNTLFADQGATANNITTEFALDGLNNLSFTTTKPSRVSFTFSHAQLVSNGTGDVDLEVEIGFKDISTGAIVNRVLANDVIMNSKKKSFSYTHHCQFNNAGNFKPYVVVRTTNGKGFNAVGGGSNGQVSIFIVQQ